MNDPWVSVKNRAPEPADIVPVILGDIIVYCVYCQGEFFYLWPSNQMLSFTVMNLPAFGMKVKVEYWAPVPKLEFSVKQIN